MAAFDAIVLGGTLDGLTAAACLGQAGLRVCVVDRLSALGGTFRDTAFGNGFLAPHLRHDSESFPVEIASDLGLARYGLDFVEMPGSVTIAPEGMVVTPNDDLGARENVARHSKHDAEALPAFAAELKRYAQHLLPGLAKVPTSPLADGATAIRKAMATGETAFIDAMLASATNVLSQRFETPLVRAHIALDGLAGTGVSPHEAGSFALIAARAAYGRWMGRGLRPSGGGAGLAEALAACVRANGGEIRLGVDLLSILTSGSRVRGVALTGGGALTAPLVISALDAKRTFLSLIDTGRLPPGVTDRVRKLRMRGAFAKINLGLEGQPAFKGLSAHILGGALTIAPPLSDLGSAHRSVPGGELPVKPWLDIRIPSMLEEGHAPARQHVMSVLVHGVPASPVGGTWTPERRESLLRLTLSQIEMAAPGTAALVRAYKVTTAHDMEADDRLTGGDPLGGALAPAQMWWNRPLPELANYATPIPGLYVCGESTHPGPILPGLSGFNAARAVLAKSRRAS